MSGENNSDYYVKFTNVEDGIARFTLYENGTAIRGFNRHVESVPDTYEIGDYFTIEIGSASPDDIEFQLRNIEFDPDLTNKKREENKDVIKQFKQLQSSAEDELEE